MTPTRLLIGQIAVVFAIVILGVWAATQWCADMLGYQAQLGNPWFVLFGWPVYEPWKLFEWWYFYEAYAPEVFDKAGMLAAGSGFMGCAAAVIGSLWRARQNRLVTTYGSSRWALKGEMRKAGLFRSAGVFLGQFQEKYLRHDGPEHVMAFAPTRSGKGVGVAVLDRIGGDPRHQGRKLAIDRRLAHQVLPLPAVQPDRPALSALQSAARSA